MNIPYTLILISLFLFAVGTYDTITGAYTTEKYQDNDPLPGQTHSKYNIQPAYTQPLDLETYVRQLLTYPQRPPLPDITYEIPLQNIMLCTACYDGTGLCKPRSYQNNIGYCPGTYLENNQPCTCPAQSTDITRPLLQRKNAY